MGGLTTTGSAIGFTGHVNDPDTDLVYMQQRYYDPVAGTFLSVDPVVGDADNGGAFNRYAYANNSPYKYVDPDGREIRIVGTKEFMQRVEKDISRIKSGKNGEKLVAAAEKSRSIIQIGVSVDWKNYTTSDPHFFWNGSDAKIEYNPDATTGEKDEKGSNQRPAYVGLAHELGHGVAVVERAQSTDYGNKRPGTTPPAEKQSMEAENGVRADHDLPQRRSYYEK